jgi:inositol transport system ATP-binding protein
MNSIRKVFPGVTALDDVHLNVKRGQVHALMGENGAGKSTLMKILHGMYDPDTGEILLNGKKIKINNPHEAIKFGIAMVYQELNPVPNMTIAEYVFLGREIHGKFGWIKEKEMIRETRKALERVKCFLDPSIKMRNLTISNKQMVEIAKAILYNASVIVMDEPTSTITENEVRILFEVIKTLKEKGIAFIYITHKMDEVFQIADHITVLRDGRYIGDYPINQINQHQLINMMVGRELNEIYPRETAKTGDVLLEVKNLRLSGFYEDVSFTLRRGEILGVAGLVGAGRTELFETIAGLRRPNSGEIRLKGKRMHFRNPAEAIANRIVIATEDRRHSGLFLGLSIKDNIMSASYTGFFPYHIVIEKKTREICAGQMTKFNIKASGTGQIAGNLSGGNQQKVVLSKVLLTNPDLIIFDEPTRGIDVGAKSEIYRFMVQLTKQGKSVVMISSELPEIIGMSDRIMILCRGRISNIVPNGEGITQEDIFRMACENTKLGSDKRRA